MLDLAGDLIQELIDLRTAPVLPSSGVDEDALAEVLCRAMDDETYEGDPCSACSQQARAVAEWLKGQGNAARE